MGRWWVSRSLRLAAVRRRIRKTTSFGIGNWGDSTEMRVNVDPRLHKTTTTLFPSHMSVTLPHRPSASPPVQESSTYRWDCTMANVGCWSIGQQAKCLLRNVAVRKKGGGQTVQAQSSCCKQKFLVCTNKLYVELPGDGSSQLLHEPLPELEIISSAPPSSLCPSLPSAQPASLARVDDTHRGTSERRR